MNYISNVTSRFVNWGKRKLDYFKESWVEHYTFYALAGAVNIISYNEILKALTHQATTHEKIQSYRHLDWTQRRLIIFPTENKQHFISDPEKIQKLAKEMRNGENFSFGSQSLVAKLSGEENLFLCPSQQHRRLRSFLEALFSQRHLSKSAFAKEVAFMALSHIEKLEDRDMVVGNFYSLIPFLAVFSLLGFTGDRQPYFELEKDPNKVKGIIREDYNKGAYEKGGAMAALQKAEEEGKITEEEKISTTMILLGAGTHTTTPFLMFAVQELMNHPEYRLKIETEFVDFLIKNGVGIKTVDDYLNALSDFVLGKEGSSGSKWLENCYLEIQRLHPVVLDLPRVAQKEMDVEGLKIDKGEEVHLNIAAYHRDPTIWEEPHKFKPERFEDAKAKSNLMTFSLGSQSCLGKFVVPIEVKMILGLLVTLLEWTPSKEIDINFDNLKYDGIAQNLVFTIGFNFYNFSKKLATEGLFDQVSKNPHPYFKKSKSG